MNCAKNYGNLLNFVKVIHKTLLVPFFSGHGVHAVFYRPDALPATQPTASKHWKHKMSMY